MRLNEIISNGYNMQVEEKTDKHVVILIGGSRREFNFENILSDQINEARITLGCNELFIADAALIDNWQKESK